MDLDSLHHYCRIHGLAEAALSAEARALVYSVALPRFLELFEQCQIPATFFVIGEDAEEAFSKNSLTRAVAEGHELGNHSHTHPYALSRWGREDLSRELSSAALALQRVSGVRPVGFRAPGYTLSPLLYEVLEAQGYLYDSSAFPATPYHAAKACVMGLLSLLGRPSQSILDSPRVLFAPRTPYFPCRTAPYRRGDGRTLELPMAVAPWTRIPFIGTLVMAMPWPLVEWVYRSARRTSFFNFELHAVDLLDARDGIPAGLVKQQRDLAIPWEQKRDRLRQVLGWLARDFVPCTLQTAATRLGAGGQLPVEKQSSPV